MTSVLRAAVCIKQVPAEAEVPMDRESGVLLRSESGVRVNPADRASLEAALQLRERWGAETAALTMGPRRAEEALRTALAMGISRGIHLQDRRFAGGDAAATAAVLHAGLRAAGAEASGCGGWDLILCGSHSADGDTGLVGPALAARAGLPLLSRVTELVDRDSGGVTVRLVQEEREWLVQAPLPALLVVDEEAFPARLPTLKGKLAARRSPVQRLSAEVLGETEGGLQGSATRVERIYPPPLRGTAPVLPGDAESQAAAVAAAVNRLGLAPGGGRR